MTKLQVGENKIKNEIIKTKVERNPAVKLEKPAKKADHTKMTYLTSRYLIGNRLREEINKVDKEVIC